MRRELSANEVLFPPRRAAIGPRTRTTKQATAATTLRESRRVAATAGAALAITRKRAPTAGADRRAPVGFGYNGPMNCAPVVPPHTPHPAHPPVSQIGPSRRAAVQLGVDSKSPTEGNVERYGVLESDGTQRLNDRSPHGPILSQPNDPSSRESYRVTRLSGRP